MMRLPLRLCMAAIMTIGILPAFAQVGGQGGSGKSGADSYQTPVPISLYNPYANTASLGFDKLYDTYHWNGLLRYAAGGIASTDSPLRVRVDDQYSSTVILSDRKLIRDENAFGLGIRHRLSERFSAALQETSYVLSDNQTVGINTASSHAFYGGAEYRPFDRVTIEPLAGLRLDNQIDRRDNGPSYMLSLLADEITMGGYTASLGGHHRYDRLDPRILETHLDTLRIDRPFAENTGNALQVTFARSRRDFYFPADTLVQAQFNVTSNIETRTENILGIIDSLQYLISPQTALSIQGSISTRGIGREIRYQGYTANTPTPHSDISEFRVETGASLSTSPLAGVDGLFQIAYQERDEEHTLQQNDSISVETFNLLSETEARKNNYAHRTSLGLRINAGLGSWDSLSLNASSSILRYDTPSSQNTDDRDELRDMVSLIWSHRFTPSFSIEALGEVSLNHLVYLNAQRSADNAWNRIYRFSPRLLLSPSASFSTSNRFEVLANYTIYDFDYGGAGVRSFTFRQFAFTDSTIWWLNSRFGLSWYQGMRLYERGELQWAAFSERPLAYFEDHTIIGTIRYQASARLLLSTGIRYFSQSRDRYQGADRVPESFLRSAGPVTTVELRFGGRTRIFFNGWYEHQVQTGQRSRDVATLTMSCAMIL